MASKLLIYISNSCFFEANEVIFYRLEFTDVLYKPDNGLGPWVVCIPWIRTLRPMRLGRGWLRWCEFSSSTVGLRGLHGPQDAASFKMVVPRERGSLVITLSCRMHAISRNRNNTQSPTRGRIITLPFFFTCATFS